MSIYNTRYHDQIHSVPMNWLVKEGIILIFILLMAGYAWELINEFTNITGSEEKSSSDRTYASSHKNIGSLQEANSIKGSIYDISNSNKTASFVNYARNIINYLSSVINNIKPQIQSCPHMGQ